MENALTEADIEFPSAHSSTDIEADQSELSEMAVNLNITEPNAECVDPAPSDELEEELQGAG